ncbi:MAG: histidine kinase [Bacteroidales bacterium]|nr:histidine kinase [Bacteroidales bacterium]
MRILLLNIFLLILQPLAAQNVIHLNPYLKFDQITNKNGLSDNYVLDVMQDGVGYIWIATKNGLNRYNGFEFEVFSHDPADSLSLSDNLVTCLACDQEGNIWAGTLNGLNKFDANNRKFLRYYFEKGATGDQNFVRALLYENTGIMWVETADGILHKLQTNELKEEKISHDRPSMINTYFYHTIYQDRNEKLWIGGRYMGIYSFDPGSGKLTSIKENPSDKTKKRDNDVACYFEDSQGNFWISGTDGLYTFDPENQIFHKILPVSTFSIKEDLDHKLWVGTGNGIYIFNIGRNEIYHSVHDDNNPFSLNHNHINKIYIDRNDNIWIATIDGISIYRPSKNKFMHIRHIPENENTPVSNHITCFLEDSKKRIWVGTSNKGLECFDSAFNKLFRYNTTVDPSHRLVSDNISTLEEDEDGDIWVGLWSGRGFHIINPDVGKNNHHQLHQNSLKADWYNDFLKDSKGNMWVGIWGAQGLYRFNKSIGKFTNDRFNYYYDPANARAKAIAHDGHYIWIALQNQNRMVCLDPNYSRISSYSKDYYAPFDFNQIHRIVRDKVRNVIFITNKGNYKLVNDPYFSFIQINDHFTETRSPIPQKNRIENITGKVVLCVINDDNGKTWAGTYDGLYQIKDHKVEAIYRYENKSTNSLINDTIWSLDFKPPNELWIGTNKGICSFNPSTGKFKPYNQVKDVYLSSHLISFLSEDSDECIWVGTTDKGVNRLNPGSGKIQQFLPDEADSSAFWGNEASCFFQDKTENFWIGGKGINIFDKKNNTFGHLTEANGLAGDNINCILQDDSGFIWVSTNSGLSRIDPSNFEITNYYEKDGLQDNAFSRAGFKLSNGKLLFGGKNGISIVDPYHLPINDLAPTVAITEFKLFDKELDFNFSEGLPIRFAHDENYFSFEFTALDFSGPELNKFAYKLENFDYGWNYTNGDNRIAKYADVKPGNYIFRVKAANMDGVWNETGISIPLIIKPPFWKTPWFYAIEILLLISAIIFVIKYREKKIREQNRFLVLEQKLLRSQMNPHFIFNSLSSIQSFIFENNAIEAGSYLSRFAELIRSILYNSREEFIRLEKEIQTLTNYLDLQKLRYDNKFDYEIDVDPKLDVESISIPPMLAQPFIENAIEHGIKYLDEKGFINISFTLFDDAILFIIEDNGIGLKASKKINSSKAKEHQSLATIISRERIEILNKGKRKKLYYMDIKDSMDTRGKVTGTIVKFMIPFNKT